MKRLFLLALLVVVPFLLSACSKSTSSETCPITTGSVSCGTDTGAVTP